MGKPQNSGRMTEVGDSGKMAKGPQSSTPQYNQYDPVTDDEEDKSQTSVSRSEGASYVHEMAIELKGIAESAKLSFLAYLLDLVIEESAVQKRGRL
jgi:hypothetical protein